MVTKLFFDKYYMLLVEVKDFKVLIENTPFFDQPVENKQESYETLAKMSKMMVIEEETY